MGNGRAWRRRSGTKTRRLKHEFTGFEPMQHNMWTFEGQIEQMDRFARALNRNSGWRRRAGKALFTRPLWLALGVGVIRAIVAGLRWLL